MFLWPVLSIAGMTQARPALHSSQEMSKISVEADYSVAFIIPSETNWVTLPYCKATMPQTLYWGMEQRQIEGASLPWRTSQSSEESSQEQ